ncbi:MAG: VCBS repeat-containing protein [Myxococcota bacterium]
MPACLALLALSLGCYAGGREMDSGIATLGTGGEDKEDTEDDSNNDGEIPVDPEAEEAEEEQEDVICTSSADCLDGEACEDGVCQVARCGDDPSTSPPLGQRVPLLRDFEVVIADSYPSGAEYQLWYYDVDDDTLSLDGQLEAGTQAPVDVAGGNLLGTRPDAIAVATAGSTVVQVVHPTGATSVAAGLVPIALATGDVDGNGRDDVIMVDQDGHWAACDVQGDCIEGTSGVAPMDAAAGDVDGDGQAELVLTGTNAQGYGTLVVINPVSLGVAEPAQIQLDTATEAWRVAVGDLDGDDHAEIVTLYDSGIFDSLDDELTAYALDGEELVELGVGWTGDHELIDIEAGTLEDGGPAKLVALTDDAELELVGWNGGGEFFGNPWQPSGNDNVPLRLALADTDGDGAMAELVDGPAPLTGRVAPIAILHYPPYDRRHAPDGSSVGFGTSVSGENTQSSGLSFGVSGAVGYSGGLFGSGGSIKTKIAATTSTTFSTSESTTVESGFVAWADPNRQGPHASAVVLAWGCYEGFTYAIDDPAGLVDPGERDEQFMMAMPVGGGTTVWSSHRYNAVVDALGHGPQVGSHHNVGDPSTYSAEAELPDGSPVAPVDLLFAPQLDLWVSDIARTTWALTMAESEQIASTQGISLEISAGLSAAGFEFEGGASVGATQGYATTLSTSTTVGGDAPPLLDDPQTTADEYTEHRYSFSPYVYLRHHQDEATGDETTLMVVDYTVVR